MASASSTTEIAVPSFPAKLARASSASAPATTPELELQALREENASLIAQLNATAAALHAAKPVAEAASEKKFASLDKVRTELRITADELSAMRAIFHLFDTTGSGKIRSTELKALHAKLGEQITDEEASDAVKDISGGGDSFEFEQFVQYWAGIHPSQRGLPPAPAGLRARSESGASAGSVASASGGAGAIGISASAEPDEATKLSAEIRERKRQQYQARFKFVKAKISNPAVGRIYTETSGPFPSLEYRVHFYANDEATGVKTEISPWHDVPFRNPDGSFNMIVEIPKWSRRKFEIATTELYNPIKQDTKNGMLREYNYGDMLFNYGAIPQTWEDPKFENPDTHTFGDNDPIDVVDIGTKQWSCGSIVAVKVLGVLGLIDNGETDWKLIAINITDPLAPLLHDIADVEAHMPGAVDSLRHWLKHYKKPFINEFAYDGEAKGRAFAEKLIEETHHDWKKLIDERGAHAVVTRD